MARGDAGAIRIGPLLLLLLLLGGAGGWNYHRNLEAERAEPRPYRGLAEADLEALAGALEAELDTWTRRYEAATGRKLAVHDGGLLAENVQEFERVQAISRDTREIGQRLSQTQGSLGRVRQEQRRRETERDRLRLHLRRLFGFR
jgi:transcriptional regulator with XRE-family HTH domain